MSLAGRIFRERRRVMVPILVLIAGNLVVLAAVVWPLQRSVAGAEETRNAAIFALDAARKREADAKGRRESKTRAEVELQKFYGEILPKDYRGAVEVTSFWLSRVAEETGLTFRAGQWDRDTKREGRLTRVTGQVTLVGEYANIRRFLYEVESALEFAVIESVQLSQSNVQQAGTLLEVALSIATYYLTDHETGVAVR